MGKVWPNERNHGGRSGLVIGITGKEWTSIGITGKVWTSGRNHGERVY